VTLASEQTVEQPTDVDEYWDSGYVVGLLVSRYFLLRGGPAARTFSEPAPTEVPLIVRNLLSGMCRGSINRHLFETSWQSLDRFLSSQTLEELQIALRSVSDASIQ
jgi:hypothetical protein